MRRFLILIFLINLVISSAYDVGAETSFSSFYKIGTNDVLDIRVQDNENLRTMATVTSDGTVSFPYIGTILVRGLTLSEIEKIITEKLSEGYIKYPVVTVSLMKALSNKFFSYGEVPKRGEIPLEEKITVIQALSLAGGVTESGRFGVLKVRRKHDKGGYKDLAEAVLNDGVIENNKVGDILLQPDDIIIVERNRTFLIEGEVANRGRFILEKDMTVLKGLLQAGGISKDGLYGRIKVRRKQDSQSRGYKDIAEASINDGVIESKEVENTLLQPDDIVIVERNRTFLIQGEVANRGRFILEKDMTVLKGLLQAGGISKDGLYGKIKVRRKPEEASGSYNDIVEGSINDGVIESKEVENTLLQPDDIVIVERNKSFLIYGEVNNTGEFVLKTDMTVFKALTIAGGFTKWGSEKRVKVLRIMKDSTKFETITVNISKVINGDAEADILLQPNDVVVVSTGIF